MRPRPLSAAALLLGLLAGLVALAPRPATAGSFQAGCAAAVAGRPAAAIVALDPRTGRLLALVHPERAHLPCPPGSIWKLVAAIAADEAGVAPVGARMRCDGAYRPAGSHPPLACWLPGGHGALTLEGAIGQSCNVCFYQWGDRLGASAVRRVAARCGLGAAPGHLPAAAASGPARWGAGQVTGLAVTPWQVARLVGAIATDGCLREPAWLPRPVQPGGHVAGAITLARLRRGLREGALAGTSRAAAPAGLAIAGKTGTAGFGDGSHRTYGWFAGYAPADHPRVLLVVLLPGASGSHGAAPIARAAFGAWLAAGRP